MRWKALSVIDHRREFVRLALTGEVSVAALCRRFGISRQTGFTLLRRHREAADAGLADRSWRPRSSPRQVSPEMAARILELRAAHPRWGGRKLARRLRDLGVEAVPAPSTVTEVLRRAGQIDPAGAMQHKPFIRFERSAPNELWQIDFKGHIAAGSGRCHPLTVLDDHSRYALGLAVPASRYKPSHLAFPEALPLPPYHETDLVRRVRPDGCITWKGRRIGLSQAFAGLDVALRPTAHDERLSLHFMRFKLGEFDIKAEAIILPTVRDVSEQASGMCPV